VAAHGLGTEVRGGQIPIVLSLVKWKDDLQNLDQLPPSPRAKPTHLFEKANDLNMQLTEVLLGEVRIDNGSRAVYGTAASNYRQIPTGAAVPRDAEDVTAAVSVCSRHGTPISVRRADTSPAGQCWNAAVVLDFSKYMHQIMQTGPEQKPARVQAGVVHDDLRNQCKAYALTFAPDPSTHSRCTIGGLIGKNSCSSFYPRAIFTGRQVDAACVAAGFPAASNT
jgi:FAD binding domain